MNISKAETLLMFSGGLDSTGVFYKLVGDGVKIHVHHMNLINEENRADAESTAVRNILVYMKELGEFTYSESTHEVPSWNSSFLFDSDVYNLLAGSICSAFPNIKYVALGLTKTDTSGPVSRRIERGLKIFSSFGSKAQKLYPLLEMTKKEVYNMLPEKLRSLTWSCRRPVYKEGVAFKCNRCKACIELRFGPRQQ